MKARIECFMIERAEFNAKTPAGAIFKVEHEDSSVPDFYVVTPGGLVRIAGNCAIWVTTGEFPKITARPSILISECDFDGKRVERWHGYLTDGFLEEI